MMPIRTFMMQAPKGVPAAITASAMIVSFVLSGPALANEPPPATGRIDYVETVLGPPPFERFSTTDTYAGETLERTYLSEDGLSEGRGVIALASLPSVTAVATSNSQEMYSVTVAQGVYYMSVLGGAGALVPTRMRGLLEASDGATFWPGSHVANSLLIVRDVSTDELIWGTSLFAMFGFSDPVQRREVDQILNLRAGRVYRIIMHAFAGATGTNADYENARVTSRAFVDPYFNIDPLFLSDNPGFSLAFSPGVGNTLPPTGGIPEPSTWALMILGFGATGAAIRSRRRVPASTC
jgi:hypothetical protein